MQIPLHHNTRTDRTTWSSRKADIVDLYTTMAAINPNGFRQPKTGKHRKQRRDKHPTRLDQVFELEQSMA